MSWPRTAEGWKRFFGSIADALNYPIIATQPRPITVVTLLWHALFLIAAFWVSRRLQVTLRRRVLVRLSLDPGLEFSILRFVHYAVLALALLFALETLHVDLTGLAVVAGILSVGIGFGLQNLASNFISGIILLIERPMTVGDQVTVGDVDGHCPRDQHARDGDRDRGQHLDHRARTPSSSRVAS